MQAIILAAGMGKRLKKLTKDNTKCMVKVNHVTMIERMLNQLDKHKLSRIVIVAGYKKENLKSFIKTLNITTPIIFVDNDIYDRTNNIYSLFLAKEYLLMEDTLLLESDLIFEDSVLDVILDNPFPNLALVAKYESWMDGTVVTIDEGCNIKNFLDKNHFRFEEINRYYKTVNIYKFSKSFSNTHYVPFLEAYCKALGNNEYYEQVLKVITLLDKPEIKALPLTNEMWYEIDDIQDLDIAESIFTQSDEDKLTKIQKRYGGYWRYPNLIDFCYLVNPFYPPTKLIDEIKANFERLICEYPSGQDVNNLLAAKYFDIDKENIVVGNGAAELIKTLMEYFDGNIGITLPTFEEYPNRIYKKDCIIEFYPANNNFSYSARDLINFYEKEKITTLILVNPDNPSGNYIPKNQVVELLEWTRNRRIKLVVDESFIDFVDQEDDASILTDDILNDYPNLVVIKSISKSFGVPGLRLGILASSDYELINCVKKDMSIWNINSFAEFYLQIFEKYKYDYQIAIEKFLVERKKFMEKLADIPFLRVIPSEANFIMCEIVENLKAKDLTKLLLNKYNILIKDLSAKNGIKGEYIRIAVKKPEENNKLIEAINMIIQNNKIN